MLRKFKNWLWENRVDVLAMLGLFVVAAIPRMWGLGTFLTADEKNWMGRSYEFIQAIKERRFNDTLQTTHPGVTTLWLSGLAITVKAWLVKVPFSYPNLIYFVKAGQFPIALVASLSVPVMYFFLRRLFSGQVPPSLRQGFGGQASGVFPALLASLFIALDPFLVGHSRVVHVDALLASFMLLGALAMMIYKKESHDRKWLVASAIFSGLAVLTKFPALFLVPFFILLRPRVKDFYLWLAIIAVMFLALWPAMIFVSDPKGNALLVKRDLVTAAETPHHMTEEYSLNSYHYPLTILTRTTPVALVFAAIAVISALFQSTVPKTPTFAEASVGRQNSNRQLWLLVAYIFFFVIMMTIVAKKGDRYILPIFPALNVLAAFGILGISSFLRHYGLVIRHLIAAIAVVFLISTVWKYHPYAIAYSSPLFRPNLSQELGWGEGLEQVATWLNEHDPKAVVASWYPEELGAYTTARVAHINAHEQSKIKYVVLYRNMFGRAPDHYVNDFIDEYYKKREPVFVARVSGQEFAWVYRKWVFDRITGELVPGKKMRQALTVTHDNLAGIDVLVATYSGRAKSGELIVSISGGYEWTIPVAEIQDDRWLTLRFPKLLDLKNQTITVEISAQGTKLNDAPTIRSNQDRLGVRLRYALPGGAEATEEDTRLLRPAQ